MFKNFDELIASYPNIKTIINSYLPSVTEIDLSIDYVSWKIGIPDNYNKIFIGSDELAIPTNVTNDPSYWNYILNKDMTQKITQKVVSDIDKFVPTNNEFALEFDNQSIIGIHISDRVLPEFESTRFNVYIGIKNENDDNLLVKNAADNFTDCQLLALNGSKPNIFKDSLSSSNDITKIDDAIKNNEMNIETLLKEIIIREHNLSHKLGNLLKLDVTETTKMCQIATDVKINDTIVITTHNPFSNNYYNPSKIHFNYLIFVPINQIPSDKYENLIMDIKKEIIREKLKNKISTI